MKKLRIPLIFLSLIGFAAILGVPRVNRYKVQAETALSVTRLLSPTNAASGGTGFVIQTRQGGVYTLTNDHVCALGRKEGYLVAVPTHGPLARLRILARSLSTDLCLLEAPKGMPALKLGPSILKRGERFFIYGHPLLDKLTASDGKVLKTERIDVLQNWVTSEEEAKACQGPKYKLVQVWFFVACTMNIRAQRTTAPTRPGSSGSPVLDFWGRVRGIVFAGDEKGRVSFIIPLDDIRAFLTKYEQVKARK